MKHKMMFLLVIALWASKESVFGQNEQYTYKLVTNEEQLVAGGTYLIASSANDGAANVLSYDNTNNRKGIPTTITDASITTEISTTTSDKAKPYELILGGKAGAWTFFDNVNGGYLNVTSEDANRLKTVVKLDNYAKFSITIGNEYAATIIATGKKSRNIMMFNNSSNLFCCYSSDQEEIYLYKKSNEDEDPIITVEPPTIAPNTGKYYENQTVSIVAEEGCNIYYTVDGSSPSTSSLLYESPFSISVTTTIKAIAVDADGNTSQISSSVITIAERESNGSFEAPYTYDDIKDISSSTKNVWMKGIIIGYIAAEGVVSTDYTDAESKNKTTTLAIGYADATGKECIAISFNDDDYSNVKAALNTSDNRFNLNREAYICGKIDTYWGINGTKTPVKAICRDCAAPFGYILAGSGFTNDELDFVFSDNNATSIDIRYCVNDVSAKTILNPNALIIKSNNEEEEENVILKNGNKYTCQKLNLNNGGAFRAPFDFTANEASYTMKISEAGYATLCLPFDCAIPEGVTAYKLENIDGNDIIGTEVDMLEADKPLLIKGEQGEYIFNAENVEITPNPNMTNGILKGVYSQQRVPANNYVLQMKEKEPAFYIVSADKEPSINPFRAYISIVSPEKNLFGLKIIDQGETDNINVINGYNLTTTKECYNISGIRISAPQKGLNIIRMSDGSIRKIFIK